VQTIANIAHSVAMRELDKDRSGEIDYNEFLAW
jgi:hypothetical protein